MDREHNLLVEYLRLISIQEKEIARLKQDNKVLQNRVENLSQQKQTYKQNALHWKERADEIEKVLKETYNEILKYNGRCGTATQKYAREQYEKNS